jgi:hypothetical protein
MEHIGRDGRHTDSFLRFPNRAHSFMPDHGLGLACCATWNYILIEHGPNAES